MKNIKKLLAGILAASVVSSITAIPAAAEYEFNDLLSFAEEKEEPTDSVVFAPEGGIAYNTTYSLSDYNWKYLTGVEITFKEDVPSYCCGDVFIGDHAVKQTLNSETISGNKISFAFEQYKLDSAPDTFTICNYYSLGEIESVVFSYMANDRIEVPEDAVVIKNIDNKFSLSEYENVDSLTLVFDDIVYFGGGAIVTKNWDFYNFTMNRSNANYITIDVENLTNDIEFYNYWIPANLDYIILNGENVAKIPEEIITEETTTTTTITTPESTTTTTTISEPAETTTTTTVTTSSSYTVNFVSAVI